ncbi:MAG: hypothetical protein ACD_22C00056G0001 [uncultured bacterium]|nr:MAG: hypothetical protein ACD_22C00056G0001 [uncultured bacterium]
MSVDALDNGVNINPPQISGINTYSLHHILSAINSAYGEENRDAAFSKALEIASLVISGEIKKAEAKIEGERFVNEQIELQGKPDFLVLDKYTAWESAVSKNKKVKLVIFPDSFSTNWCLQVARDDLEVFGNDRINFPHNWRGLSDHELALTTQIPDAVFCHASGFYAVVKTKQAAITMASKVIREGL